MPKATVTVPENPKIYHITHLRNLARIVKDGCLFSDSKRIELGLMCDVVGLSKIKERRLKHIGVTCHPKTTVGQYVPFYFCPRSIMLYILYKGNHPDVQYKEGQGPILHLQADLSATIAWARKKKIRWAFSDRNAGGYLAAFFNDPKDLEKVDWEAVAARDFRDMVIKEGKQAEFLVFESFPWDLVERVGVIDSAVQKRVKDVLKDSAVPVEVERDWYY